MPFQKYGDTIGYTLKKLFSCQAWWCIYAIPVLGRWMWDDYGFEIDLSCISRPSLKMTC